MDVYILAGTDHKGNLREFEFTDESQAREQFAEWVQCGKHGLKIITLGVRRIDGERVKLCQHYQSF